MIFAYNILRDLTRALSRIIIGDRGMRIMRMLLKYGRSHRELIIDDARVSEIIRGKEGPGLADPAAAVRKALKGPIGAGRLSEIARGKGNVVVVVNDITRPTPYSFMLPPLLEELEEAGTPAEAVKFVVATGLHRGQTPREMEELYGKEVVGRYRFLNHDCDQDLVSLGKLRSGNELFVNRQVAEADLVVTTGVIGPHYFAGFSGGRKSILPGVAGRQTVQNNHSLFVRTGVLTGRMEKNPIHEEMLEAARRLGVDFILNVVANTSREIVEVVAGDLEQAWLKGVRTFTEMYRVPIHAQSDVVIASAGGYPKDINLYQAQKALENAAVLVRDGGTVVLLAECPEGMGDATFEEWMRAAKNPDEIINRLKERFVMGGHKAYAFATVLRKKEVVLISGLGKKFAEEMFFTHAGSLEEALENVRKKHGDGYRAAILPEAGAVMPVMA